MSLTERYRAEPSTEGGVGLGVVINSAVSLSLESRLEFAPN